MADAIILKLQKGYKYLKEAEIIKIHNFYKGSGANAPYFPWTCMPSYITQLFILPKVAKKTVEYWIGRVQWCLTGCYNIFERTVDLSIF